MIYWLFLNEDIFHFNRFALPISDIWRIETMINSKFLVTYIYRSIIDYCLVLNLL